MNFIWYLHTECFLFFLILYWVRGLISSGRWFVAFRLYGFLAPLNQTDSLLQKSDRNHRLTISTIRIEVVDVFFDVPAAKSFLDILDCGLVGRDLFFIIH